MTGFNIYEVQKAVTTALKDNSTLTGMLGNGANGIRDNVASAKGLIFPYLAYTDIQAEPLDTTSGQGSIIYLTITAFTKTGNKKEASDIMREVHTSLHRADLTVTGFGYARSRWDGFSTIMQEDVNADMFSGIIRVKITLGV
jgi:hypothetical protein